MLIRADALLVVVDLNDAPLTQMEDVTAQLDKMRISIGEKKSEENLDIPLYQKKALIIGNKLDLDFISILQSYIVFMSVVQVKLVANN